MQKIFIKQISTVIAIFALILISSIFYWSRNDAIEDMYSTSELEMDYIQQMFTNNLSDIETITRATHEDYVHRAESVAYILSKDQDMSHEELKNIAKYMYLDDINIYDENGVIILSTLMQNIGASVEDGEQIGFFKPILEDPTLKLVQNIQPSSIDGRMMQYIGVAKRQDKGIVQIGMYPARMLEALNECSVANLIFNIETKAGEEIFVIDIETGLVKGSTLPKYYNTNFYKKGLSKENVLKLETEKYLERENEHGFYTLSKMGEYVIITYYDRSTILAPVYKSIILITLSIFATAALLVSLLLLLLRRHVIKGIKQIIIDLSRITEGNLTTTVEVNSNSEFRALSVGINTMVKHLLQTGSIIANIIESLELNIGIYEYRNDTNKVYLTDRLSTILELEDKERDILSKTKQLFGNKLLQIQQNIYESQDILIIYYIQTSQGTKYITMSSYVNTFWTLGIITDVTEYINSRNKIINERDHDELTGLLNRKGFNIRANDLFSDTQNLKIACVFMIDIDNLKYINDVYSHSMGDKYINLCAAVLKKMTGEHNVMARLGGDEFAILLYGYDSQEKIIDIINQMRIDMHSHFIMLNKEKRKYLSFSAGYVFYPQFDYSISDLLHLADLAMYKAKQNGKNQFQEYDSSLNR